jgi:hypothetical protein
MPVAVQHVRRMRGGAQAHLMRCDDGHFYVVKFQNNPQHLRVLANELLATRLAKLVGLPVPEPAIVSVDEWIVQNTPELSVQLAGKTERCPAGLQFGARYAIDPMEGMIFDYLPETLLDNVRNLNAFAGMLAFDKWTCNSNGRQAVFWKKARERKYTATFIDQGYCFNAGEWNFPDSPLRGVYAYNAVYKDVRGWKSFEPWLSKIESFDEGLLKQSAEDIPTEWSGDWNAREALLDALYRRRKKVAGLIDEFRASSRSPFPNWVTAARAN